IQMSKTYNFMDFPWHSGKVLGQLNEQRQLGLLCDCTFVVDGVDFKAHKAVLAACSLVSILYS
uniref:BTB domain-containing protein n=1 Tax=Cyprinus carpio TaxID=7962 RepID=A0A8C2KSQ1_CYPCA